MAASQSDHNETCSILAGLKLIGIKSQALSEALRRSIAKHRALWRGVEEPVLSEAEGTPAMLVGRCSWELSGRKLHRR